MAIDNTFINLTLFLLEDITSLPMMSQKWPLVLCSIIITMPGLYSVKTNLGISIVYLYLGIIIQLR